jgi:hypothetical protein
MAFFICPECGKLISGDVTVCPHCQAPIENGSASGSQTSTSGSSSTPAAASSAFSGRSTPVEAPKPAAASSPYYDMSAVPSRNQGSSKGKIIGIIIGAVVLIAAIAVGVFLVIQSQNSPEKITASAQAAFDKGDYAGAMEILKNESLKDYAPAKKLQMEMIAAQAGQLVSSGDYDAAFKLLDDSGYRDNDTVDELYTQLQYEVLVIQCIPDLLANVPNPESIDIKEIRLYSSEKYAEAFFEGRLFPKCYFILNGQAQGDELFYMEFGPKELDSQKMTFSDSLTEGELNGTSGGDDILITVRAGLMNLYLDGYEPLAVIDGAKIMKLIENDTYKNISEIEFKDLEAFSSQDSD